jgi:PAS domain S-box-containing protein
MCGVVCQCRPRRRYSVGVDGNRVPSPSQDFRTLVDNVPDIIGRLDREHCFIYVNPAAERSTGFAASSFLGRRIDEVGLDAGAVARFREVLASVLETGRRAFHVFDYPTRDGVRAFEARLVPERDPEGGVASVLVIVRDLTSLRRAQAARADSESAADRLADADRRKDEFLAVLGHELRNPLAPIRNAIEILRRSPADPRLVEWASEVMERQIQQLVRLVDDLLDVSRLSRGRVKLEKALVPLSEVLTRAVETGRPIVEARRHTLQVSLPPDPVTIDVDPARLAQAVGHLLHNAAKYTEEEGTIRLSARVEEEDLVLSVRDSGMGIPKESLPKIFDLFGQAGVERPQGGLGIGLTVVKRIVEMHGGSVAAESGGAGHGSEFRMRLPVVHGSEREPSPKPEESPRAGGSRRVLVVEDDRDAAESLVMFLELTGYKVAAAHDGAEAVDVAKTFDPDVVLLDVGLPVLDGYEVARRLRDRPGGERLMLVALTGYGQEEDRRRSSAAGFDHHLVKPVDIDRLLELLSSSVRSRRRL